jgi:adenylylsulfate kinase
LTGLPRAGKSSLAYALESALFQRGRHALVLDGEVLRRGMSADLGFSGADRAEHLRRAAELAHLFNQQGLIVIAAFVAPTEDLRKRTRGIVAAHRYMEVFCDAPLEVCEGRDKHGLFSRARAGEIANVTGIDQPYERPQSADLRLDTARVGVEENVKRILDEIVRRAWI